MVLTVVDEASARGGDGTYGLDLHARVVALDAERNGLGGAEDKKAGSHPSRKVTSLESGGTGVKE